MSVYVDPLLSCVPTPRWKWRESCHMVADTVAELHAFARSMGLRTAWFQATPHPHYDLTRGMRNAAVRAGAVEVDRRQAVELFNRFRQHTGEPASCPAA